MILVSQVWQALTGVKARRVERYYYDLLAQEINTDKRKDSEDLSAAASKWKRQIEKVIRCLRLGLYHFNL